MTTLLSNKKYKTANDNIDNHGNQNSDDNIDNHDNHEDNIDNHDNHEDNIDNHDNHEDNVDLRADVVSVAWNSTQGLPQNLLRSDPR